MSHGEDGYYSELLEPILDVCLLGPYGGRVPFPALVDTGYNSSILIFETERKAANLPETRDREAKSMVLADGSRVSCYMTFGFLEWFCPPQEVDILVLPVERTGRERCIIGIE